MGWQQRVIKSFLMVLILDLNLSSANAAVVSRVVGRVGDYFLTSREVLAVRYLEKYLFPDQKINIESNVSSPEFVQQVTSVILEKVVSVEAESFAVATVGDEEVRSLVARVKKELPSVKGWQALEIGPSELEDFVLRKIRSKKFLRYKSDAANLTVTDYEVKDYYEKNRYKFGNLPLENFKENIRQFLAQKQTEDRLREWFEVLRKKYQVRNFLAEAG